MDLNGGPYWAGAALASGLIAASLLIALSRGTRPSAPRAVTNLLLTLRLIAAGLLALLLAEPIARRVVLEPVRGRLIVAVDLSDSMDAPRREAVRKLLEAPGSPLSRLADDHDLDFLAYADGMTPASRSGLIERLIAPAGTDAAGLVGNATDWRPVLAEAARPPLAEAPPTVAVVLVGDGQFHASSRPGKAGADDPTPELARLKVPVFPLLIGPEEAPRDLAVAGLDAPETAFLDDTAPVEVRVAANGFAGREVAVTLTASPPGKPPFVSTQTIRPATDRDRPSVRFQVPLSAAGTVPLTVAVAPAVPELDPQRAEARLDNNGADRTIEVTGEPARVLLIDGEPRWEFRYLRNALARDPRVKVEAVVLHPPELSVDRAEAVPTFGRTLPEVAEGDDPLGRFDAIVLGDVAAADIPGAFWGRLESHVGERGGSLIVAPGPVHWAELWGEPGDRGASRPSIAAALSPLVGLHPAPTAEAPADPARPALPPGLAIVPTPEAVAEQSAWPMFRLRDGDSPEGLPRFWADLPRQPWALVGRPKPGAVALAVAASREQAAVMASQRFGLGRVFWIGIDGTWRWRYRVGDALHHRFWGQTVRWASASAKLTAGDGRVRFGVTRTRAEVGELVRVRARISESLADLPSQPILAARVAGADGSETLVPLRPLEGLARTFEGDIPPLEPGRYAIRLEAPGIAEDPKAEASFQVVPRATGERVELSASRVQFDPLARATGGAVLAESDADRLPELLRTLARTIDVPRSRVVSLWDRPATFLIFLAIVTAEWIIRKRAGLP